MTTRREVEVSSVAFVDAGRRLLTVRKRGTARFMLVGGKLEAGESPSQAAVREAGEEVGIAVDPRTLVELGRWSAAAANEPGWTVTSTVFLAPPPDAASEDVRPSGEIEEVRWLSLSAPDGHDLAPLLTEHVLPALRASEAR